MTDLVGRPREELIAAEIRHRFDLEHGRIDPFKVAHLLDLHVVRYPVQDGPIEGQYRPLPDGGGAIFVNSATATVRQRFTAAHEIGHALFHKNSIVIEGTSQMFGGERHEKQANRFAGALLVDRLVAEEVLQRWDLAVDPTVAELVETFAVSPQTAAIALEQFNLIAKTEANAFLGRYQHLGHGEFMELHGRRSQYRAGSGTLQLERAFVDATLNAYAAGQIAASRAAELIGISTDRLPKWAAEARARIDAAAKAAAEPILEL